MGIRLCNFKLFEKTSQSSTWIERTENNERLSLNLDLDYDLLETSFCDPMMILGEQRERVALCFVLGILHPTYLIFDFY